MLVLEVPEFERVTVQVVPPCKQLAPLALTRAVVVNVPKRPNTNPAMAMAAMSVIAIRITVASTGEIAFLAGVGVIILDFTAYENMPENGTLAPFVSWMLPTNDTPAVPEVTIVMTTLVDVPAVITGCVQTVDWTVVPA